MRRRLLTSTLTIVVAILLLFGIPIGIVLDRSVHSDARSRLTREATQVARYLANRSNKLGDPTPAELNRFASSGDRVIVFYSNGVTISNLTKVSHPVSETVPGPHVSSVTLVRAQSPRGAIDARTRRALLVLIAFGVAALLTALGLAWFQSKRLADPLLRLARSAARLGDGDFSLSTPRSGVTEMDEIASALDRSAARIEALLRAERSFSEQASHQLRTPLTGLQLRIEGLTGHPDPEVREEAEASLEQCARLLSIIEELLALARTGRAGSVTRFNLADIVRLHVDDVQPILARTGRRAVVVATQPVPVLATLGAVGQVLDILLSNALRHGAGRVTVTVSSDERRARLDVTDEGPGITDRDATTVFDQRSDSPGHGIGLPLAQTLVTTEGGTITLVSAIPPVFRVELPLG